jgi:hypothetical protein
MPSISYLLTAEPSPPRVVGVARTASRDAVLLMHGNGVLHVGESFNAAWPP